MSQSSFNAMRAAVDPRGVLIRDHLDKAGEAHGRNLVVVALDRIAPAAFLEEAVQEGVATVLQAECVRMLTIYGNSGCSRRQLRAYLVGFRHGSAAALASATALLALDHEGTA